MPEGDSPGRIIDEAALLLTCLRGLPYRVPLDTDWQALLGLAVAHGVLLIVHNSFLQNGIETPGFFAATVGGHRSRAEKYAEELAGLLRRFAERNIDVLPLKGPALAEVLYGDAALRSCDDLDLLVRHEDFSKAEKLLFDAGFSARPEPDDYHRKFVRDEVMVELHFRIASPRSFPFDLAGAWSRARRRKFRYAPMLAFSDEDLVLFLCLHGLKHGFSRLIWIMDVARAVAKLPRGGFEALERNARRQNLEQPLLIACETAREALPELLPSEIEALVAGSPQAAAKARDALERLFAERAGSNNDPEIWGFYLQNETGARQRWRRRLTFLIPTIEDYSWAERHRIHRSIAPMLRPFRLLRKYGPLRVWRILFPPF